MSGRRARAARKAVQMAIGPEGGKLVMAQHQALAQHAEGIVTLYERIVVLEARAAATERLLAVLEEAPPTPPKVITRRLHERHVELDDRVHLLEKVLGLALPPVAMDNLPRRHDIDPHLGRF